MSEQTPKLKPVRTEKMCLYEQEILQAIKDEKPDFSAVQDMLLDNVDNRMSYFYNNMTNTIVEYLHNVVSSEIDRYDIELFNQYGITIIFSPKITTPLEHTMTQYATIEYMGEYLTTLPFVLKYEFKTPDNNGK